MNYEEMATICMEAIANGDDPLDALFDSAIEQPK